MKKFYPKPSNVLEEGDGSKQGLFHEGEPSELSTKGMKILVGKDGRMEFLT